MRKISLEKAQNLLFENHITMEKTTVSPYQALGKVLGESIIARENIPPFARSPYDGYALISGDTANAAEDSPATLEIIEEIPAGCVPQRKISAGKAAKILTGAPIPDGADTIIQFEATKVAGNALHIFSPLKPGKNIVPIGEDISLGDTIAREGSVITAPLMGMLACLGIKGVSVYQQPKIAIISIGDELVDYDQPLGPGKIRNSNSFTLAGYCREMGLEPTIMATAQDKVKDVASLIDEGLKQSDLIITTGGASVGDYDVTSRALEAMQAQILYHGIEIKPGSPSLAAVKDGKIILGLSGNPAASAIVFQLLAVPLIKKMTGHAEYLPHKIKVILKNEYKKASTTRRFLRGKLNLDYGMTLFEFTGEQGNGILSSLISSNVLAEIPPGTKHVMTGEQLDAYLINFKS